MTQEEKQLLLKDLCARLPYHPKAKMFIEGFGREYDEQWVDIELGYAWFESETEDIKPYLRPLSSMTAEENEELKHVIELGLQALESEEGHNTVSAAPAAFEIDFYNKHHFDYRGLIPMGLALEAPEGMYKTE